MIPKILESVHQGIGIFLMPFFVEWTFEKRDLLINILTEDQKITYESIQNEKKQEEYLQTRLLMNTVFWVLFKNDFDTLSVQREEKGKPRLLTREGNEPVFFNLSHTKGFACLAVTQVGEIGVDVEGTSRNPNRLLKLARRWFHPEEFEFLQGLPEEEVGSAFLTLFTLKESWAKCVGNGIDGDFKKTSLLFALRDKRCLQGGKFFFHTCPTPDLFLACSVLTEVKPRVEIFRVSAEEVLDLFLSFSNGNENAP